MNEAKLREYAELIVKIGANVQKGQRVRLQTGVDQVSLLPWLPKSATRPARAA